MIVRKIGESMITPLGFSVEENFQAVLGMRSALRHYEHCWNLPFPSYLSLIQDDLLEAAFQEEVELSRLPSPACTRFEKLSLLSAVKAVRQSGVDPKSERVLFVLSSTKGNVSLLSEKTVDMQRVTPAHTAQLVADYFGNPNTPITVSNACISGLCAQMEAYRCLQSGQYDAVVVVGADALSPFIVAGFQSLRALSVEQCHPFSDNRNGLNLGEAAAAVVWETAEDHALDTSWKMMGAAVRNDANHISGPSRTGEGSYRALQAVLQRSGLSDKDLACLNVHGTATLYNDEMEAIAIDRAGLASVPVNALKGYYGHTLGAAGVLEVLLTMCALDHGLVPATRGFEGLGVSVPLQVSAEMMKTTQRTFVKLLSGFGGCNAAAAFTC